MPFIKRETPSWVPGCTLIDWDKSNPETGLYVPKSAGEGKEWMKMPREDGLPYCLESQDISAGVSIDLSKSAEERMAKCEKAWDEWSREGRKSWLNPTGNPATSEIPIAPGPPENLSAAQKRVAQSLARTIIMHGDRQSGKSTAAFAALERNFFEEYGGRARYPSGRENIQQLVAGFDGNSTGFLVREYTHYLIRHGWEIAKFEGRRFTARQGHGELQLFSLNQQDGGNLVGTNCSSALVMMHASRMFSSPGQRGDIAHFRHLVSGLLIIEVIEDSEYELVEFSGREAV